MVFQPRSRGFPRSGVDPFLRAGFVQGRFPMHARQMLAVVLVLALQPWLNAAPADQLDPLEQALKQASVDGKYRMLLRQIKVSGDEKEHGRFHDRGYQQRSEYAGHNGLPAGHWVYAAPYWYIWRELSGPTPRRAWGPEQLIGPPDTWPRNGDIQTAWASLTEDGQ